MKALSLQETKAQRAFARQRLMPGLARGLTASVVMVVAMTIPVSATEEPPAQVLVRDTTDQVLAVLKERKAEIEADPTNVFGLVDEYILPHFDFYKMSRRALGKHWRKASPEQRERFVEEFKTLLVRTYAIALARYTDETVEYLAPRKRKGSAISVRTQILLANGPPIPINYEMYSKDDQWKVYDVAIDGVSLVVNYRSTFASQVRRNGVDGLIERLAEHNRGNAPISQ